MLNVGKPKKGIDMDISYYEGYTVVKFSQGGKIAADSEVRGLLAQAFPDVCNKSWHLKYNVMSHVTEAMYLYDIRASIIGMLKRGASQTSSLHVQFRTWLTNSEFALILDTLKEEGIIGKSDGYWYLL